MKELKTISLSYPHEIAEIDQPETVCAIGFFDGVHQGHQHVIKTAQRLAKQQERQSAVMTFSPHPSAILRKSNHVVSYLTPLAEKQSILEDMGVDVLYVIAFNQTLAKLAPIEFIGHFIVQLGIKHLVSGFDFTYGYKGEGNADTLIKDSKGKFGVTIIDKCSSDNIKISSSRIRQLLQEGDVQTASQLLGRPLVTSGYVIKGDQRGRTIGFPTANIMVKPDYITPKIGVYAVKIQRADQVWLGMANLGYNPTFEHDHKVEKVKLEVHLFDFDQSIYGEELSIEWYEFIRSEQKFTGIEQLVVQLKQDEEDIRQLFRTITQ